MLEKQKPLVIIRLPEVASNEDSNLQITEIEKSLHGLKDDYCFILTYDSYSGKIEFEYPKNYILDNEQLNEIKEIICQKNEK